MHGKAKILVVDDLHDKLLVYQSILEELQQDLVLVQSGSEALRHVLRDDFAVILLDVNMPDMDGFETAAMIRSRKRSAHTPIIFITAYADELHAMKGYSHGAVDYILAPVIPDVLRTKVRVFVDLWYKTREIQEQAHALRELERRELERELQYAAQSLSHTTQRLDLALEAGRMGAWEWDLSSHLLTWSPMVQHIFGFHPGTFTGSVDDLISRLHPDDRESVLGTLRTVAANGSEFCLEHRIVRENGEVAWVEVRGRVISAPLSQSPCHAAMKKRITGVCMDITQRKSAEEELRRHREQLEQLVRERTAELKASHERLRLADRLASIGTLAAGLGHDMGNLLMPIQMRLDALEKGIGTLSLSSTNDQHVSRCLEDIKAIRTASEYLKRLSQGLRLFALDPEESWTGEGTVLAKWWNEVKPFLCNALPRTVRLVCEIPTDVPAVAIPPHTFTQVIYNLVQNAGDALRLRDSGTVTVSAQPEGSCVRVSVSDDGPGMSEEVKSRCMEPFFTTKSRGISTGLGLALVHGAVTKAGGSIHVESQPERGTTFHLLLPAAQVDGAPSHAAGPGAVAYVLLNDARIRAYVAAMLRGLNVHVAENDRFNGMHPNGHGPELLVLDSCPDREIDVMDFVRGHDQRWVVRFGEPADHIDHQQVMCIGSHPPPADIRKALVGVVRSARQASQLQPQ